MQNHRVRVWPSAETHDRAEELSWKIAQVAADPVDVGEDAAAMVVNRVIDNASVALASINRGPIVAARAQALAHARPKGATLFGLSKETRVHAEWAAWANGTAVRELDFHDTFLHMEFGHPGDNICPLIAVAQQKGCSGTDLIRGVATAYEVHVNLMKGMRLHSHKIDHVAHTGVGAAAGIGAMLGLAPEIIYQAINQTLHVCCATRQSRKGQISSWKSAAPAHSSKLAIEAVDRAMRGETAPAPIYEGEDSVIAWLLDGPDADYTISLPEPGEPKRAILETWTKAHSAEYQGQAFIDLAIRLRDKIGDLSKVRDIVIRTNFHAHDVIGTGANDPQKFSPDASRETLDHSLPYIFAVALEDGRWHHEESYTSERAHRPETIALWRKIRTEGDDGWERRYLSLDPAEKAYGGQVRVTLAGGDVIDDEIAFADAHPLGAQPFGFDDYVGKFRSLAEGGASAAEQDRFVALAERLGALDEVALGGINPVADAVMLAASEADDRGIF
jgi:2-methylcitrate dehydratase